jgi:hypothetical protein
MMAHQRDMDLMMAAISEEETLEAQLEEAHDAGASSAELHRLGELVAEAMKREVEAEGEADE